MKVSRILSVGIAAMVVLPAASPAVDYNWIANPGTVNWTDAANWDALGVPVSGGGNSIYIHTPGNINIAGVPIDAGRLFLSTGNAGDPASGYTFGAGTSNISSLYIGENFTGTTLNNGYGNAFINGGTVLNVGSLHLGERAGASGHIVQSGGDVNISNQFRLGHWPQGGAANSYDMNGGTFTMTGPVNSPLNEGAPGNFILGIDSSGTFTVNSGTLSGHGITMQTRNASGGESKFVVNGGTVNIGVNGMVTNQPTVLTSYDVQLGGGTLRATANWSSNLETKLIAGTGIQFDTNGFNVNLSGAVNDVGGLTKSGAGNLILSGGGNTYTGATSIAAGTLQISSTGSAPTTDITVQNGGALQVDATGKTLQSLTLQGGSTLSLAAIAGQTTTVTNALNFSATPSFTIRPGLFAAPAVNDTFDLLTAGSIVGTPGVIITDFGLSHATGHTTLLGNKLVLTIDTAGGLLTWNNATGSGNWQTNGDINFSGADGKFLNNDQVTFGTAAAGAVNLIGALVPAKVIVNSNADYSFGGAGSITGVGALSKSGSGTLNVGTINTYSGGTTVSAGVLNLTAQSGGTGAIRGAVTVGPGAELRSTGNSGAVFGFTTGQKIDSIAIDGGLVNSVGGENHLWNAAVTMTGGEIRVNDGVSSPTGLAYQWSNTTLSTLPAATTALISGRLNLRADAGPNFTLDVADGAAPRDLLISAALTESALINVTKNGAGAAEFSGGMTTTGNLRVTGGALTLSGATPFGATQAFISGGSVVTLTNGANLSLNLLAFGIGGQNETIGGTLNVGPGATLNVAAAARIGDSNGGGSLTQGVIAQTGGTVNINALNTDGRNFVLGHWGATQGIYNLSGGTLNSPNISMAVSWDGEGTFNQSGGTANVLGLRFGHNGGRTGVFHLTGGELNLGAEGIWEEFAGLPKDINLGGGTVRAAVNTTIFLKSKLTGLNGDVTFDTNGNVLTVTGEFLGDGGFTKTGAGRMVLDAPNYAAGIFTVNAGTLSLQGANQGNRIPAEGLVQISNGGTLEFGSANPADFSANYSVAAGGTLTNAAGVDHVHLGSVQLSGGTWTTDAAALSYNGENYQLHGNVTVTGATPSLITQQGGTAANRGISWDGSSNFNVAAISSLTVSTELENADAGTAALVKSGAGTLTLAFANSYSGGTTVSAGILRVNNPTGSGTGSGNLVVAAGATLAGSGTVGDGGAVSAALSGKLAPGNSAGTLSFHLGTGTLDLTGAVTGPNSAALQFELGSASDLVRLTSGRLNIGTGVLEFDDFSFTQLAGFSPGDYLLFDSSAPILGTLGTNVSGTLAGGFTGTLQFTDGTNDLRLHVVPEPTSAALLFAGLGLLGLRRRRRAA